MLDYILHLSIQICMFTILAQSLSILAGFCGQISLAHAGFYAIGAYVAAILSITFGWSLGPITLVASILAALLGSILAIVANRTVDDYYIIITMGFQFLVFSTIKNWRELTGGANGLNNIPPLKIVGIEIFSRLEFFAVSFILLIFFWFAMQTFFQSRQGKRLRVIGQDEIWAQTIGINVFRFKLIAHAVSSALAAIAGILYATYSGFIDPTSFTIDESIFILSIVILGGMRDLKAIFLTTIFLILIPEVFRLIGFPDGIASNLRQIFYGSSLIIIILYNLSQDKVKMLKAQV